MSEQAEGPLSIFVKCAFLEMFDSLFHTADNELSFMQIIGATIYVLLVFV